ncbi:hypothetical protein BGX27_003795 [Mortierella sp. AM989]|nr:hypothetical protein BGX27_003795 [Mortierella sp. AM989]
MRNQKDIIKIAYIPDIPNTEPFQLPELAHLGGGPHAAFFEDDYDKHVSVASSLSTGVLDEAVVMAMNNKATPKLLKLNAIKTNNSDMIQRSNSLHSSNSIKRTQSQRRVATAAAAAAANRALRDEDQKEKTKGNLSDETIQSENRDNVQQVLQQYTPAVMVTGPSARSSAQSTASTKRKSRPPNMVLEPRPLHPSYHVNQSSSPTRSLQSDVSDIAISGPSTKVTTSVSTPVTLASILTSTINTSLPPASASPTQSLPTGNLNNLRHSAEVLEGDERRVPWSSTPHHSSPNNNDKAATVNSPPTTRNSTFSTQSDSRSTITRGDGEEIMIFWDGHRDSRSSDNI